MVHYFFLLIISSCEVVWLWGNKLEDIGVGFSQRTVVPLARRSGHRAGEKGEEHLEHFGIQTVEVGDNKLVEEQLQHATGLVDTLLEDRFEPRGGQRKVTVKYHQVQVDVWCKFVEVCLLLEDETGEIYGQLLPPSDLDGGSTQ